MIAASLAERQFESSLSKAMAASANSDGFAMGTTAPDAPIADEPAPVEMDMMPPPDDVINDVLALAPGNPEADGINIDSDEGDEDDGPIQTTETQCR